MNQITFGRRRAAPRRYAGGCPRSAGGLRDDRRAAAAKIRRLFESVRGAQHRRFLERLPGKLDRTGNPAIIFVSGISTPSRRWRGRKAVRSPETGGALHAPVRAIYASRVAARSIFDPGFLTFLKTFVDVHHSIYPTVPPQGIYFEALVERTFRAIHKPLTVIKAGGVNQPRYDIEFKGHKISLKTETGLGTRRELINITKLCTTEREPWQSETLKIRAIEHLSRYDIILMLRAIWEPQQMRYQLVDIPIHLLRLIAASSPVPVGSALRDAASGQISSATDKSSFAFTSTAPMENVRSATCE